MPKFDLIPMEEAKIKTARGKRAGVLREYLDYVGQLTKGQAGRLVPGEGETVSTIRRRIGAAAREAGKNLSIKRVGDEVYFWVEERTTRDGRRRRGRPRES